MVTHYVLPRISYQYWTCSCEGGKVRYLLRRWFFDVKIKEGDIMKPRILEVKILEGDEEE
jgi:hypothetical protein